VPKSTTEPSPLGRIARESRDVKVVSVRNRKTVSSPPFRGFQAVSLVTSKAKRANRNRDTTHELLLRRELWHLGLRYRKHAKQLPGRPDIVFTKARVALFCDGDFWHGRFWPRLRHKLKNGSNAMYWTRKLASNRKRDVLNTKALKELGWHVLRVWETDIRKDPKGVAHMIALCVKKLGRKLQITDHKAKDNEIC
jgi:DNA mismatch endonuclease, patch repair protein